jgi:hypothetical protein
MSDIDDAFMNATIKDIVKDVKPIEYIYHLHESWHLLQEGNYMKWRNGSGSSRSGLGAKLQEESNLYRARGIYSIMYSSLIHVKGRKRVRKTGYDL